MRTRSLLIFMAGAILVGASAAWVVSDFRPVPVRKTIATPGQVFVVDVHENRASFDLTFEPGTRYCVIIGNLAPHDSETAMELSAERISTAEQIPLKLLARFRAQHTPRNQSWGIATLTAESPLRQRPPSQTQRTFHIHVTDGRLDDARQYATVHASCVAERESLRIFLDTQVTPSQLSPGLVPELLRLFEQDILPRSRETLGDFRDVDGDGKFSILLSPWLGRLQGGKTSLGGFVRGSDFQNDPQVPFGDRTDVLYLNTNLKPGPHLKTLLAHEFAHAVCFSERMPTPHRPETLPAEDDWLNESIAHLAENCHHTGWTNLDSRISTFLDSPERSPLVVPNYYTAGLWRDPGCRGATFLFLRWIVEQHGIDILPQLIQSPMTGTDNLERATGQTFAELFRHWTVSLATSRYSQERKEDEELQPLSLTGEVGSWGLQGPRVTRWNPTDSPKTFFLPGTTARFLEIQADEAGTYRFSVEGMDESDLQVTVLRLPEANAWSVSADWLSSMSSGNPRLRVSLNAPDEISIRRMSVECRAGSHQQSVCLMAENSQNTHVISIPRRLFPREKNAACEWQLKILARDSKGTKSASWIELPPPPMQHPAEQLPVASRIGGQL